MPDTPPTAHEHGRVCRELALAQAAVAERTAQLEALRSQLTEATATLNSQAAELRVLWRQRQLDAEHLKACETARRELQERQQAQATQLAEAQKLRIAAEADARNVQSVRHRPPTALQRMLPLTPRSCRQGRKLQERRQTKQARADKAILVRALEALADELAHARADARRHAAAAESARSAAQRLGQAPESGVDTAEERGHRACGTARFSWPWAARQPSARVPPAAPIHALLARRRGSHVSMCCVRAAAGPARAGAARRGRRRRRRRAQV